MAKWLLVSHYFVVGALAASEAQLKFVPVPVEERLKVKDSVESLRSSPRLIRNAIEIICSKIRRISSKIERILNKIGRIRNKIGRIRRRIVGIHNRIETFVNRGASGIAEMDLVKDEGRSQSCGPQSPCLEPDGLFPVDGNCCGFVNCANCRPFTQRCAAGTVFDLDLWICNHERDTQQCAGNNRECAFQTVNLRGQAQDYDSQDDGASSRNPDGISGSGSNGSPGWEYASASEVKEVKKKTGKVSRVKKVAKASKA
ncbi:uncharacterized protein LOC100899446 [Galendromus occidentalis]|uniref:Uncharacterized protein LOC100899446 n=1 Tax=Galendromus occidentalis TaxID=34638 RepID=A0AAJ7L5K1_9ACAR|nr:uncharacterized protein LOC100899446 [Galendromus occidentalis]